MPNSEYRSVLFIVVFQQVEKQYILRVINQYKFIVNELQHFPSSISIFYQINNFDLFKNLQELIFSFFYYSLPLLSAQMFKIFKPQRRRNNLQQQPSSMPHRGCTINTQMLSFSQSKTQLCKVATQRLNLTYQPPHTTSRKNDRNYKICKENISPKSNLPLSQQLLLKQQIYNSHRILKRQKSAEFSFCSTAKSSRNLEKSKGKLKMSQLDFSKKIEPPFNKKDSKRNLFLPQNKSTCNYWAKNNSVRRDVSNNFPKQQIETEQISIPAFEEVKEFCRINILIDSNSFQVCYKVKKIGGLIQFLKKYINRGQMVSKRKQIITFRSVQQNLQLDYFLTLQNEDGSWLNGTQISLAPFFMQSQSTVNLNSFQICQSIGSGGFSTVYLCRFKEDGKFYAMKIINKDFIVKNNKRNIVMNERNIMIQLNNQPFLAKIRFAFESKSHLVFVMDYYEAGQLFNLVKRFKRMKQHVAKFYIIEILLGLQQVHKHGIVYRDFKPENIMIDRKGHAYIADFGLAKPGIKDITDRAYSFCGSPEYMPPQMILKQGHSFPVDFYCIGALLYELTTGLPPFYNTDPEKIYEGTLNYDISFPNNVQISKNLRDLLQRLLFKDQRYRLGSLGGVKEILAHPWFGKIKRELYFNKQIEPPISFEKMEQMKFNIDQMCAQNQKHMKQIQKYQKIQENSRYLKVMNGFYYDWRTDFQTSFEGNQEQMLSTVPSKPRFSLQKKSSPSLALTNCTKRSQGSFQLNNHPNPVLKNKKQDYYKGEKPKLKKLKSNLYSPYQPLGNRLLKSIQNFF